MRIEFSAHSLDQLRVRKRITKAMVVRTINFPDTTLPSYKERIAYRKDYSAETLEVVVRHENDKIIVITEYFLEEDQ